MSVRWITWAWEQECSNAGEKLTLIALADHAGESGSAFPGCARLGEKTGQGESTIRRHLDSLEAAGMLERERRRRPDGTLGTYAYQLLNQRSDRAVVEPTTAHFEHHQRSPVSGSPALTRERAEPSVPNRQVEPSVFLLDADFEAFWATYGRVGPKKDARKGYEAARKKASAIEIQQGLERWVAYWAQPGAAKVKWPQGWLTEERWNDDPPVFNGSPKMSKGAQSMINVLRREGKLQ
jgi:DNA-binding transcriptional ArsR family regulator/ribosomal protein S11